MGSGKDPLGILTPTRVPDKQQEDPLGILKKKAGGGVVGAALQAGGAVGSGSGQSEQSAEQILSKIRKSPTTQADIDRQNRALGIENFDANDPVKSVFTPLRIRKQEIFNRNIASESTAQGNQKKRQLDSEEVSNISQAEHLLKNELFPTTTSAQIWLRDHPASEKNETSKLALDVVNETEKTRHFIEKNNGSLTMAAIDMAASKDDRLGRKLKTIIGSGASVSHAAEGELLHSFLQSRYFKELPPNDPIKLKAQDEMQSFYKEYPELMYKNILSKIAQGREDYGFNNAFANFPGKYSSDMVMMNLEKDGKITPEEKDFYLKFVRPIVEFADIPTPGLVETIFKSAGKAIEDVPKSVYELTGLRNLIHSKGEILSDDLEEDILKTNEPHYKGLLKNISHAAGNLAGIVIPISGEAKLIKGLGLS